MPNQIQGRATIKKDGVAFRSQNGATLMVGGTPRESVPDDQGRIAYRQGDTVPGGVRCTVLVDEDFEASFFDSTNVTIEFVTDNGLTFVVTDAFLTTPLEVSGGTCEVEFQGQPATQL